MTFAGKLGITKSGWNGTHNRRNKTAKAFSLASWNAHNLSDAPGRVDKVVEFLSKQDPDVFGLYEVVGKDVYDQMVKRMPGHQFHITEGPQTQEILVGVRGGLSAFFTQKIEFKGGNTGLRPGALLTVNVDGGAYPILFLHTKSSSKPVGLGIRDDQFERALKFKATALADAAGGKPNYLFLGDLNTMGMTYPYNRAIPWKTELKKLEADAKKAGMAVAKKNRPYTWWGGSTTGLKPSNLDQVVAVGHLKFAMQGTGSVDVRGWPQLPTTAEQQKWIKTYSDHALLYMEVQKI